MDNYHAASGIVQNAHQYLKQLEYSVGYLHQHGGHDQRGLHLVAQLKDYLNDTLDNIEKQELQKISQKRVAEFNQTTDDNTKYQKALECYYSGDFDEAETMMGYLSRSANKEIKNCAKESIELIKQAKTMV